MLIVITYRNFLVFFSYQHKLLLSSFMMPDGTLLTPAASRCFGFCSQSKAVAEALPSPYPHGTSGEAKASVPHCAGRHKAVPVSELLCGGWWGAASPAAASFPTRLSSRADREHSQDATQEQHCPQRYYRVDTF